jgi:UDP-glucose 4-epimerase
VYGDQQKMPITDEPLVDGTTNTYGTYKLIFEHILQDLSPSDQRWSVALLRYFNPIGAH